MKLAFLIYSDIDMMNLLLSVDPLRQAFELGLVSKDNVVDLITCDANPAVSIAELLSPIPLRLACSSLDDYDLVVITGRRTESAPDDLLPILKSIKKGAEIVLTGNAISLAKQLDKPPLFIAMNRGEVLTAGFELCARVAGADTALKIAEKCGISKDLINLPATKFRWASITRQTNETSIDLQLALDGSGKYEIDTGIPFFDHMLTQLAVHGLFDLKIVCKGDLQVDSHHTVEDVALALGKAFDKALGERKGLVRMASATVPMDECLAEVVLDFSGRPYAVIQASWQDGRIGDLPTSLISHFLESFAVQARCNLFVRLLAEGDDHHRTEAIFKALARALDAATQIDLRRLQSIPSSKGVI